MSHPSRRHGAQAAFSRVGVLALAAALGSCSWLPRQAPVPVEDRSAATAPASLPAASAPLPAPPGTLERPRARWVPASFAELPGWQQDRASELWPALRLGCSTPAEAGPPSVPNRASSIPRTTPRPGSGWSSGSRSTASNRQRATPPA